MNIFFYNIAVTVLAEIVNLRAYAFKINKNNSSLLNHIIIHNKELILCKDITISLFDLKESFKQLTLKTHKILFTKLLFIVDAVDFSNLTLSVLAASEDLLNNSAQFDFFTYNLILSYISSYLQKKVFVNKTLKEQMFFKKRNKLTLKSKSILNYTESLKRFLLHLQLLMHFTASVLAWVTKLNTLTYCNSITSAQQTLLFNKSACLFMLRLRYTKNFLTIEQETSAVKYFCTAISYITALYICYESSRITELWDHRE